LGAPAGRAAAVAVIVLAFPVGAAAASSGSHGSSGGLGIPFGFLGISLPNPLSILGISISGILKAIATGLFKVLAGAFLPSWFEERAARTRCGG